MTKMIDSEAERTHCEAVAREWMRSAAPGFVAGLADRIAKERAASRAKALEDAALECIAVGERRYNPVSGYRYETSQHDCAEAIRAMAQAEGKPYSGPFCECTDDKTPCGLPHKPRSAKR